MRKLLANRKGFTLIELMIVVAIIGILAAVAIPAFLRYIRDSKTAEAQENLSAISKGALAYYDEEHNTATADDLTAGATGNIITGRYPVAAAACSDTGNQAGQKQTPNTAFYTTGVWKSLRFNISKPHYYQYCYDGQTDAFTATAQATLDSSATASDSIFILSGAVQDGRPVVGNPIEQ